MATQNIYLGFVAVAGGTGDVITGTWVPAPPSLYDGLILWFRANATNTLTNPTLNVNSLGAKTITKNGGSALVSGDIKANNIICVVYRLATTTWEWVGGATNTLYKVYTALLTQSGTNAPTVIVLENTLGGTIVWTRNIAGYYVGTLANAFTAGKTWILIGSGLLTGAIEFIVLAARNSVSDVYVQTGEPAVALADDILDSTAIEIRVYY